jgi:hypothetical protein
MKERHPWKYADAFEREIQAFLRVFPEFIDECPIVDISAQRPEYTDPQRIMTAKGAFGIAVWLRFHEQAKPSVRDALISGFIEEVPGGDALYQEMIRRMSHR